jgi:hypothetical protein
VQAVMTDDGSCYVAHAYGPRSASLDYASFGSSPEDRAPTGRLNRHDSVLREQRGVYYTPEPVSYIVRGVDAVISSHFECKDGLGDRGQTSYVSHAGEERCSVDVPRVLILDPACGTGTFLYSIIDLMRERFRVSGNAGMWSSFVFEITPAAADRVRTPNGSVRCRSLKAGGLGL